MKTADCCYWLQGLFELADPKTLDEKQATLIKQHLALVFVHDIDPKAGNAKTQAQLNEIHSGAVNNIGGAAPSGLVYRC